MSTSRAAGDQLRLPGAGGRAEVAAGAVHVPGWLDPADQLRLVAAFHEWARPPAGLRHARMPNGVAMSVATVCLGWHWYPYRYSRTVDDGGGEPVKPFPGWLGDLARAAVTDAYGDAGGYRPDVALINRYDTDARLGMHQDRDEHSPAPVVSLSLGDTCVFRFGNPHTRNRPWTDVQLRSGDLFVFGGPSRLAYHGVTKTVPGSGRPALRLAGQRINITVRESGL